MNYFAALREAASGVVEVLSARGIDPHRLRFGGADAPPARQPTVPTDARSEFLANRAMGDWAEALLSRSLRAQLPDWQVSQYGSTERVSAGDPGFRAFYLAQLDEVRRFGKRPDLLLFPQRLGISDDLSRAPIESLEPTVNQAIAAIEVRSSKFEALRYIDAKKRRRLAGKAPGRETPSFTGKVEDLKIVYRWLERHDVPQSYVQVFYDSVYAIGVLEIFRAIADLRTGIRFEQPAKSQEKATVMIPITEGLQIGTMLTAPEYRAEVRVTELGRHDAFVVPVGGQLKLDEESVRKVLLGS